MIPTYHLHHGDYLEYLATIPSGSVDMILTDPPYGTTAADWDTAPDMVAMWREFRRVIKPNGAMLVFAQIPFSISVCNGNIKDLRYEIIWQKARPVGHLTATKKPMQGHENIFVFYKSAPTYNPQMRPGKPYVSHGNTTSKLYGKEGFRQQKINTGERYPTTIMRASAGHSVKDRYHPTQKPVEMLAELIRTYTNPGDTVLDPFAGSGSTGVAAVQIGRNFLGSELDEKFYNIANNRISGLVNLNLATA